MDYAGWRRLLADERLPAALVDRDAFDRNRARLVRVLAGADKRGRLATKSLRVPSLIARGRGAAGDVVGLMCYAAAEAALLADEGHDDLLVAYPTARREELAQLVALHAERPPLTVRLVVDGADGVRALAEAARAGGVERERPFPVVLDVDVSLRLLGQHLGVRRSPLHDEAEVDALLDEIARHPLLRPVGAMAYEAQVAGLADDSPHAKLLAPALRLVRRASLPRVASARDMVARLFARRGLPLELLDGGGTGSVDTTAREAAVTEVAFGSGLLAPTLFDHYTNLRGDLALEPALFFALPVARTPAEGFATCFGGGYVASGAPGWDKVPIPVSPPGLALVDAEGCGEVQTPLRVPAGTRLSVGDPVLFRPAKAGELAERFTEYLVVSNGKIVERAKTYRGLGWCFG